MDESINGLLVDFTICSMVQADHKLYLQDGNLALEPISFFSPIRRFLSNSNRYSVTTRIKQRIQELEMLLEDNQIKQDWVLKKLSDLMPSIIEGMRNLQRTYSSDSQISATLELLIARLNNVNAHYLLSNFKEEDEMD
jgi:hypothetical protein